jgi:ubiquinone/menaquinone biosynthesis C-methylase UbiE
VVSPPIQGRADVTGPSDPGLKRRAMALYDRVASSYGTIGPPMFDIVARRLVDLAALPAGARVLDVATGRGAVLFPAAAAVGPEGCVIGVDLSREMVRWTRAEAMKRAATNVRVARMDAERLALPSASFDRVLCSFALFLLPDVEAALREFRRVLKPGGRAGIALLTEIDPRWSWYRDLLTAAGAARPPSNDRPLTEAGVLEHVLTEAGFARVTRSFEEIEIVYRDEDDWWATQWTHAFRVTLEQMAPRDRDRFMAEASARMQSLRRADGLPFVLRMAFWIASTD